MYRLLAVFKQNKIPMRKTIITQKKATLPHALSGAASVDLDRLAQVWLTSEAEGYPIESALLPDSEGEWRAGLSGEQIIRLVFDQPLTIRHIGLVFDEQACSRTQEFVLRWSADNGEIHEILRQQYHFSPPNTTSEVEQYTVNLPQLKRLELTINPDMGNENALASLKQLRLWQDDTGF